MPGHMLLCFRQCHWSLAATCGAHHSSVCLYVQLIIYFLGWLHTHISIPYLIKACRMAPWPCDEPLLLCFACSWSWAATCWTAPVLSKSLPVRLLFVSQVLPCMPTYIYLCSSSNLQQSKQRKHISLHCICIVSLSTQMQGSREEVGSRSPMQSAHPIKGWWLKHQYMLWVEPQGFIGAKGTFYPPIRLASGVKPDILTTGVNI